MPVMRLPYMYEADLVEPRHRKPAPFLVKAFGEFEIPEASVSQAPLATEWVQNDSYAEYGARSLPEGPHRRVTRFFDGLHYVELAGGVTASDYEAGLSSHGSRPFMTSHPLADGYPRQTGVRGLDWNRNVTDHRTIELVTEGLRQGRATPRIHRHDREARLIQATGIFPRTLLVVDGRMWSSEGVREPHYEVILSRRDGVSIRVSQGRAVTGDALSYVHAFRADRFAEALDFARRHAALMNQDSPDVTTDEVIVHHAPSVTLDHVTALGCQVVSGLRLSANHFDVHPAGAEVVRLARDAQELKASGTRDREWAIRMLTGMEALDAAIDADPISARGDFGLPALDEVLARWRELERPLIFADASVGPDETQHLAEMRF